MEALRELLVLSGRLENRRALLRILEAEPVLVFTVASVEHAREVLATHSIELVFCEENFADGSYRDLLKSIRIMRPGAHFVLMLCTGEWVEYLEALRLGVWEVLRCPLQPTDVELVLLRSARQQLMYCTAPSEENRQHPAPAVRAASSSRAN